MRILRKVAFDPMLCPAMRATMGDRWYYVATMTFAEIARAVKPVDSLHTKKDLSTWIQRELRPERTAQIASYLRTQKQRFFNALVLAIYGGEPEWQSVGIEASLTIKDRPLDERQTNAFGMVYLSGKENIFAIDGQHRVEGIRLVVEQDATLGEEEQTVIFVAHHETDAGRERTRRLFATLNTYARPISDRETVAISQDDAFAIATRRLIDEYPGLNMRFVPLLPSPNIPPNEKACITSVVGLYQMTQFLAPPDIRRSKRKHKIGPPEGRTVEAIFDETRAFWDALKMHITPIRKVCASDPGEELAAAYRHAEGGHLLFRPVGMQAFVRAARILMDRGESANGAVGKLAKVPLDLAHEIWREVLWRPETKTMLNKYVRLALNVLLHRAGQAAEKKYAVQSEYKRITGREYPK